MVEPMQQPLVDIVIPVHSTTRPLARAVSSALGASEGAGPGQCRIVVAAHHLSAEQVLAMLPGHLRPVVSVLVAEDRGVTAAVPRNEALRASTARYISFLDSDDTLDRGAVTRWLGIAERRGSELVIPFQHHEGSRVDITPLVRPWRSVSLHAVKDRLPYRSTAFGLVRVASARAIGANFDESVPTGEDQAFIMALYSAGYQIDYASGRPGLLMHADAVDRVSGQSSSLRDGVAAALDLDQHPWFTATAPELRASHVLKYIRVNFFPAVHNLVAAGEWNEGQALTARSVADELLASAPHVADRLSRADARVLSLLEPATSAEDLLDALSARRRFATPAALLTPGVRWVLNRQSPLRVAAASGAQTVRYKMAVRGRGTR